jgi:muramidase (phage lysozyme)
VLSLLVTFTFSFSIGSGQTTRRKQSIRDRYALDQKLTETDGEEIKRKLAALLARRDVQRFLAVIQKAEAGEPNLMVGGCRAKTLAKHPAYTLPKSCWYPVRIGGKLRYSSASGNYQITITNWKAIAKFLGLPDFSVASQQLAALELIRRGGGSRSPRVQTGFELLVKGKAKKALCPATKDWASSWCSPLPANGRVDLAREYGRRERAENSRRLMVASNSRRSATPVRKTAHHASRVGSRS